ncbi:hypothetical protein ACFQFH_01355 [Halobaculum halobium]|uniref:hypothetical protein n=1 Tax=Halobaculum halobium TaxID=3032281 RepID=UPI003614599C
MSNTKARTPIAGSWYSGRELANPPNTIIPHSSNRGIIMNGESPPPPPEDAPAYVVDPLQRQPGDRLREIATWAATLADYKTATDRDANHQEVLERRIEAAGYSANPADYEGVPDRAYISIKEPQDGYKYAYWQWRSSPTSTHPT